MRKEITYHHLDDWIIRETMKYVLDSKEALYIDKFTINGGVSQDTLIDRAAGGMLSVVLEKYSDIKKVFTVAGPGNNGKDALVLGHMLQANHYDVEAVSIPSELSKLSEINGECLIIDGLFGVGLNREVTGEFKEAIELINKAKEKGAKVLSVDIPSGVSSSDGSIFGCAVKADTTVTFSYKKYGHMMYPGREYSGDVVVHDINFDTKAFASEEWGKKAFYFEASDKVLPKRYSDSNKGSYGKVYIIAGSPNMPGAAMLVGKSVLRYGAGYATLYSDKEVLDKAVLSVPELVLSPDNEDMNIIRQDVIIIGPGLSKEPKSISKVNKLIELSKSADKTIIVDADALNILSDMMDEMGTYNVDARIEYLNNTFNGQAIFTPHKKELSRLLKLDMSEVLNLKNIASKLQNLSKNIFVLKDAATIVVTKDKMYINTTGNNGMSTPGAGDVLSGAIGACAAQGLDRFMAAAVGVYYHGQAGDKARDKYSEFGVIASDLIEFATQVQP